MRSICARKPIVGEIIIFNGGCFAVILAFFATHPGHTSMQSCTASSVMPYHFLASNVLTLLAVLEWDSCL